MEPSKSKLPLVASILKGNQIPFNERASKRPTVLMRSEEHPFYMPGPGTKIVFMVLSMQRDKQIWGEDAQMYRPERWLDSSLSKGSHNFIPFGIGPRTVSEQSSLLDTTA